MRKPTMAEAEIIVGVLSGAGLLIYERRPGVVVTPGLCLRGFCNNGSTIMQPSSSPPPPPLSTTPAPSTRPSRRQ
jgi:hypothetical protein